MPIFVKSHRRGKSVVKAYKRAASYVMGSKRRSKSASFNGLVGRSLEFATNSLIRKFDYTKYHGILNSPSRRGTQAMGIMRRIARNRYTK